MEYQQFINFLKAKHCYNEFLEILSSYQNYLYKRHKYSIKTIFNVNPSSTISNCIDWGTLIINDKQKYEFWLVMHYKWYDYFFNYERKTNKFSTIL